MGKNKPHNSKKRPGITPVIPWMAGVILIFGLAVAAGLYWSRSVTIREVRYTGNNFVDKEELAEQADVPLGVRPDSVNFIEIINRIQQIRYVKYASIDVEPGGMLLIKVTERKPLALISDGTRKIYVDREGVKLPLILGKAVDVPILYGFPAEPVDDTLATESFAAVSTFLSEVRKHPLYNATISEVAWTDDGVVALTQENGVKLMFGKTNFEQRLRNWKAFYAEVIRKKGINSMQSVDLRFKGQVVTHEG